MEMRILYGVSGVGAGHAIRSRSIIRNLKKEHTVIPFSYNRAYKILKEEFWNTKKIGGLELIYSGNKIRPLRTFIVNLFSLPYKFAHNFTLFSKYKFDVIISDYELTSYIYGRLKKKKIIGIDNINMMTNIKVPKIKGYYLAKFFAGFASLFITPNCDEYVITSFYAEAKKNNVHVFPPFLRENVLELKPKTGKKVVVYITSPHFEESLNLVLSKFDEEFLIYGLYKKKKKKKGNIEFRGFNEEEFLHELKNCKAVICYGGFSLISESLFLKKPLFVIPIKNHYEQILNAEYVGRNKFGVIGKDLDEKELKHFFDHLPDYRKNLRKYRQNDNSQLLKGLGKILSNLEK